MSSDNLLWTGQAGSNYGFQQHLLSSHQEQHTSIPNASLQYHQRYPSGIQSVSNEIGLEVFLFNFN